MVKTYCKHVPAAAFGLICSLSSNSKFDGKLAYVPALEDVLVWDVKKGAMVAMWHEIGHTAEVTSILQSPQKDKFAVGYADGSIRLWSALNNTVILTFNGHKKAVTALAFDEQGTWLVSGSQDTEIIVWDVVAETGMFRLHGHRDQVTGIRFVTPTKFPSTNTAPRILLTSSKDTFLKLWDLSTQHCMQTIVAHRSEIWTIDLSLDQDLIFTGSAEGELKAWRIDHDALSDSLRDTGAGQHAERTIQPFSSLLLESRHRVSQIAFHPSQPFFAVQSHERSVEVFRIRSKDEIRKKKLRRKKREKEKQGKPNEQEGDARGKEEEVDDDEGSIKLVDLFTPYLAVRASGKIRSFDFSSELSAKGALQIMTALTSNALEVYNVPRPTKSEGIPEAIRAFSVDLPGHRSDIRTLSLSSDDEILASATNGSLKIWNMKTNACIRTIECGHAISSTFLPGDRQIAVGTKSGEILVYDIASSALSETIEAHTATVWSLHVRADHQTMISGSADQSVKFWEFDRNHKESTLSLLHVKTLKMTDDVLAVKYSPNCKLLAVSLLDSTVKVFYQDTLKFFLSLYGHKLPVLSMDISDDSKFIVTCSADKNVKIWGLDFGDCHKSIFAHDESVMQVAFEKNSHYFWTVGKDKLLKYWDGDKFEHIQNLRGHHGEIWALALSHQGKFVVTGSQDKSIRVWDKDEDDQIFLVEERERELEMLYDNEAADNLNRIEASIVGQAEGVTSGMVAQAEATTVTKQTKETLMAGERIIEAIALADKERATFQAYHDDVAWLPEDSPMKLEPPPKNQLLLQLQMEPEEYVLWTIEKIQSTALHDALLVLPFEKALSLMVYLNMWAQTDSNLILVSRIVFFLLKTHHHQIVANRVMRTALIPLRKHLRTILQRQKATLGYNLAALQYIQRHNEANRTAQLYEGEEMNEEKVRAKLAEGKKRKRVQIMV